MTDINLPPLPKPTPLYQLTDKDVANRLSLTKEQITAYGREAVRMYKEDHTATSIALLQIETVREAFESLMEELDYPIDRDERDGGYLNLYVHEAWPIWKFAVEWAKSIAVGEIK
jgi:hypothetical protein